MHIDAIKPVWRNDLKAEWFDQLDTNYKKLMHPYDVANPPVGEGWVIQLVCHHYNPYPKTREQIGTFPRKTRVGRISVPTSSSPRRCSPLKLNNPELRLFGVHHVALAWMARDPEWTSQKGSQNNNLPGNSVPLLGRADGSGGHGRRWRLKECVDGRAA